MSRGDAAKPKQRARGVHIAAACLVFVLLAACLTLWATNGIERLFENGLFGGMSFPAEPFSGARNAASTISWRGCIGTDAGPTVGAPQAVDMDQIDAELALRGYLAVGEWSEAHPVPLAGTIEGLEGSCGLYALYADGPSHLSTGHAGSGPIETACDPKVLLLSACDRAEVNVQGVGVARTRVFVEPGLTREVVAESHLPVDVVLAHAEAASALAVAGWTPSDEVIGVRVPAPPTTYGLTVRPPKTPPSDCFAYVAVGVGLGHARVYWPGTALPEQPTVDRFVTTSVACGGGGSYFGGEIQAEDAAQDGGTVWFRAYAAAAGGPAMPAAAPRGPLAFTMHLVRAADAVMPAAIPGPPAP